MFQKIFNLLVCFMLISLTGCGEKPTTAATATPAPRPPDIDRSVTPVEFVGVRSTGSTSVELYFNGPVSEAAHDASLYQIFGPQHCDEKNWQARLTVTGAELDESGGVVSLTTAPQAAITYQLVYSGIIDSHGGVVKVEPVTFTGTAAGQALQSDSDGVSDTDEQVGWAVKVINGAAPNTICRDVNSDPLVADTDGDGVTDGIERGYATDPRSPDTDGDNLSDQQEIFTTFSSPLQVDTDQDGLLDGVEATQLHTSPALPDTDGDGITDTQEITGGGTNPLLANLPELSLDLYGDPSIILNMSTDKIGELVTVETSLQSDKEETVKTDNSSTKMSIENTVKLHTEIKAGTGKKGWPPSASAKLTTDTEFKHGYMHETSSNWTKNSVVESQEKFEKTLKEHNIIRYEDGMLWVPMKISNHSELSFKIKDLRVIAYRMLPNGSFSAVGTLTPGKKSTEKITKDEKEITKDIWVSQPLCATADGATSCEHILGPGGEVVLVLGADSLPAQEMKALVRDPSALMFEIGSYSLFQLDEWGVKETVNYAKLGESVIQRSGILVIDYGDGTVNRYMAATNAQRSDAGAGKGVTLPEALKNIIGLTDYALCDDGKTLCRVKKAPTFRCNDEKLPTEYLPADFCPADSVAKAESPSKYIPNGFWIIAGSGASFESGGDFDFNTIRLLNSQRINLVYMLDSDGDSIYDREESLLGTDKRKPDSDGDGLDDYQETKEGWTVSVPGQTAYAVYPDPRFSDMDNDLLSDATESYLGTDPYSSDTDGDTLDDSSDPYPTTPPCVDSGFLSMAAWWDGSGTNTAVKNILTKDAKGDGKILGDGSVPVLHPNAWKQSSTSAEKVFRFNLHGINQNFQNLSVDDKPNHDLISTNLDFSAATWVNWHEGAGTILAKGNPNSGTYSLTITADGKLKFIVNRRVHEKIWYCWLGEGTCDDNAAKDLDYDLQSSVETPQPITKDRWTNVMITFGGETMRIYINGDKVAEKSTTGTWWNGLFKKQSTTTSLIQNASPLMVGMGEGNAQPYKGMLDDLQFFIRTLQPDEVKQVYNIGICPLKK